MKIDHINDADEVDGVRLHKLPFEFSCLRQFYTGELIPFILLWRVCAFSFGDS